MSNSIKNADMPAMPINTLEQQGDISVSTNEHGGLTKREHFAAMAMQGMLEGVKNIQALDKIPFYSVKMADALLEELEK